MNNDVYLSLPRKFIEGPHGQFPVFSYTDDYIKNYETISADHLSVFEKKGTNPFMAEDF